MSHFPVSQRVTNQTRMGCFDNKSTRACRERCCPRDVSALVYRKGIATFTLLFILICGMVAALVHLQKRAPVMMSLLLICFALAVMFIATEQSKTCFWHKSGEAENRFGGVLALVAAAAVFLSPDSPMFFVARDHLWLGIVLVALVGYLFYHHDRSLTRTQLQHRAPYMPRIPSLALLDADAGKERLRKIVDALDRLDFAFVGTKLIAHRAISEAESDIFVLLSEASSDELNYILTNAQLPLLIYKVKDGDPMAIGKTNVNTRTMVLDLLCVRRLPELAVESRIALLDGLQKVRLTAHERSEEWVRHVLINSKGKMLRQLKSAFDTRGGAFNLHQLIFRDITSSAIRTEVLAHFSTEGIKFLQRHGRARSLSEGRAPDARPLDVNPRLSVDLRAVETASPVMRRSSSQRSPGTPTLTPTRSKPADFVAEDDDTEQNVSLLSEHRRQSMVSASSSCKTPTSGSIEMDSFHSDDEELGTSRLSAGSTLRKILSDVDDTLFASGGKYPAGVDHRLPPHTLYPGVLEFYKELDLGASSANAEDGFWSPMNFGNLVFLSARPHVYKDKSEQKTLALFEEIRKVSGMYQVPTLLSGAIGSGMKSLAGDFVPLGLQKFDNFVEYVQLYPEYTCVFVGDNGQGDVIAAEKMMEHYDPHVDAVFIHCVQPVERTPGFREEDSPQTALARWERCRIFFFNTYVGAAVIAIQRGLMHVNALSRVADKAKLGLYRLTEPPTRTSKRRGSYRDALVSPAQWEERRVELNTDLISANALLESRGLPAIELVGARRRFLDGAFVHCLGGDARVLSFQAIDAIYDVQPLWDAGVSSLSYRQDQLTAIVVVGHRVRTTSGDGVIVSANEDDDGKQTFSVRLDGALLDGEFPSEDVTLIEQNASTTSAMNTANRSWW